MKKLLLFTSFVICTNCIFAQSNLITSIENANVSVYKTHPQVMTTDTITTYFDRATKDYSLKAGTMGYVLGTSSVSTETAVHYTGVGNFTVTDVLVYIGKKVVVGTADNVTFRIYQAGADSMPTSILASGTKNITLLNVNVPNFVAMTGQVSNVTSDFLVSMEYGSIDDTISLISSNPTNQYGGPDGKGEKRVRQYTKTTPAWTRACSLWGFGNPQVPYDADAYLIPVLTNPTGINSPLETCDFQLFKAFPTPANDFTNLCYSLKKDGPIRITIFDQSGKTMREFNSQNTPAGMNQLKIDLTGYAAGNYFYSIRGANSSITSKFSVVK